MTIFGTACVKTGLAQSKNPLRAKVSVFGLNLRDLIEEKIVALA